MQDGGRIPQYLFHDDETLASVEETQATHALGAQTFGETSSSLT